MSSKDDKSEWAFPKFREAHQLQLAERDFWSIKFYPYTEAGIDPVFAVVGGKRILLCRPPAGKENTKIEVIQIILDEEAEADHYACVWSKDAQTGTPLLCVAGGTANIKIINVLTGESLRSLAGHGGDINDLAVSPINPYIVASASEDCTIRIWSLDPAHASQPCVAILEGNGHKETVLSLSFHSSGRYLLSAGIDHRINLWTLPEFPDANTGTNKPTRIYYPHFSTSEIHSDIVDCVAWWGDLILSKAANEHNIVLWSINKFDSSAPPPPPITAPTTHDAARDTRSAFCPPPPSPTNNALALYTRHVQFSTPDSEIMFTRFSLFPGLEPTPDRLHQSHPILAFCNKESRVFFWDFARLAEYYDRESTSTLPGDAQANTSNSNPFASTPTRNDPGSSSTSHRHPFLVPFQRRVRGGGVFARLTRDASPTESSSSHQTGSDHTGGEHERGGKGERDEQTGKGKIDWARSREQWKAKHDVRDPLAKLEAHNVETVKGLTFTGRQVAWSACGEWCVVVGSSGVIAVLNRWEKK